MKFLKILLFYSGEFIFKKIDFYFIYFFRDVSRTERIDFCDRELHTPKKRGNGMERERKKET
jgi:hypothetical protein